MTRGRSYARSTNLIPPPLVHPPPLARLLLYLRLWGRCCESVVVALLVVGGMSLALLFSWLDEGASRDL